MDSNVDLKEKFLLLKVQIQRDLKIRDDMIKYKCRVQEQNQVRERKSELVAAEERAIAVTIQAKQLRKVFEGERETEFGGFGLFG